MTFTNFEFKASVKNCDIHEKQLLELHPKFAGEDDQTDTYFHSESGRLKLREGNVENALILYQRSDDPKARESKVILQEVTQDSRLKEILTTSNGILAVVKKKRRIYFIENVKFHFDKLDQLGDFVEVEAIDRTGNIPVKKLRDQCEYYRNFFGIDACQILADSYSDMILKTST
ncbi:MAG: CYTH domain-containing protein [Saprospirales bacterium]|nr:MAG: CYTH domain-containing protein [Saprospirales bacterium]